MYLSVRRSLAEDLSASALGAVEGEVRSSPADVVFAIVAVPSKVGLLEVCGWWLGWCDWYG